MQCIAYDVCSDVTNGLADDVCSDVSDYVCSDVTDDVFQAASMATTPGGASSCSPTTVTTSGTARAAARHVNECKNQVRV